MAHYVICASCGARMKADRRWCLKCDEPLVGAVDWSDPAARRDRRLVAATVVSLFVVVAIALVWEARTRPVIDDTARPVAGTTPRRTSPSASAPAPAPEFAPVTALDDSRAGGAAFSTGDFEKARGHYEEMAAKQPDDPEALNGLGQVLVRLHRTDEAIDKFARAARIAPTKWAYHFNLAHALGERARWDEAIGEYRTAAGLFPTDYATQYNLAMALHKKGDEASAVPEFEKAIGLAPGEPSFHLSLAISLEKLGRRDDARREYAKYLDMEPANPDAARLKAHIDALAQPSPSPSGS